MRVAIGCDGAAIGLKNLLVKEIEKLGHVPMDLGVYTEEPSLYADTAVKVPGPRSSGSWSTRTTTAPRGTRPRKKRENPMTVPRAASRRSATQESNQGSLC